MVNACFQNSVNITPSGMPQYLAGDMIGNRNLLNPSLSAIVKINSSVPQPIGGFTWYVNNQTCAPIKAESTGVLLGFVGRTQDTVFPNANVSQGWSMAVQQGYQLQYFPTGTFAAICPSLNNDGAGPILYGDLVLINNTTGALGSKTSLPMVGWTQCITGNLPWIVIDLTPVYDAQGTVISNLVVISNTQSTI